jgi:tRNA modification GTPase
MLVSQDTIAAIATAPGRGGVGIVRLSGKRSVEIAATLTGIAAGSFRPREARFARFKSADGSTIDEGLRLYFPNPHSFTGEDVVELQGHGGPVVMDMLLQRVLELGARMARPGEFSERAFLNDKLDLAQAEAIADLIDAASTQAARSAVRSLQGAFSEKIHELVEALIHLRMYVEASIDFPEEEVDFLSDGHVAASLEEIFSKLDTVQQQARLGTLLKEGMRVVIAGRPNAGKSSLLNALAGRDAAIVTDIAGTTRDVLREHIHLDGMPLHIIDTAGLRESPDVVEREGIRRALVEVEQADCILFLYDGSSETEAPTAIAEKFFSPLPDAARMVFVRNKTDLLPEHPEGEGVFMAAGSEYRQINLSARTHAGIDALREHLKQRMGFQASDAGSFIARRRHLDAVRRAREFLDNGREQLTLHRAGELLAEDLRMAQMALSEITGEFTPDDLLGRIFSSFCIGK